MKSFSKVHPSEQNKHISAWRVADLDVQSNVVPEEVQSEHILAFFGTGLQTTSRTQDGGTHTVHANGTGVSLASWVPDDLSSKLSVGQPSEWEFVDPTSDFFKIPEQQIWQEKFEAEKERIEIIKNARAQAEAIVKEARGEARNIIEQAQSQSDERAEQARQEGYELVRAELQDALGATHAIVEETQQWQAELMRNSEQTLMEMLKDIAQTIFGDGVRLDPNALQINLNRIMENAQRLGELKIFLNPVDANLLDPSWSNYQLLITGNKVRVVPSEKIKPGGCVIKGSTGMVDARVETQLNAVLTTIDEVNEVSK